MLNVTAVYHTSGLVECWLLGGGVGGGGGGCTG